MTLNQICVYLSYKAIWCCPELSESDRFMMNFVQIQAPHLADTGSFLQEPHDFLMIWRLM